eukprot:751382-Hanusia_phi.AAC.7
MALVHEESKSFNIPIHDFSAVILSFPFLFFLWFLLLSSSPRSIYTAVDGKIKSIVLATSPVVATCSKKQVYRQSSPCFIRVTDNLHHVSSELPSALHPPSPTHLAQRHLPLNLHG